MKKIILVLALITSFVLNIAAQTPAPTTEPAKDDDVVKISTTLIQIDVTVTDKSGKIINDLKPEDFEIFENGEKQDISNFSFISNVKIQTAPTPNAKNEIVTLPPPQVKSEQVRRTVALVVDDLSLSFQSVNYVRNALKKFVNEQMQDGDLVAIIRTGAGIGALQQFTNDKRQLLAAIEKVRWNPIGTGNISAFAPIENSANSEISSSENEDEEEETSGGQSEFNNFRESLFATGTLGAVNFIVRGMKELPGRKSVMLLSDGFQIFSRNPNGALESSRVLESLRRLVDLANRSSVVIYTMDARGLQTLGLTAEDDVGGMSASQVEKQLTDRRDKLFDTQEGLIYLARETGGIPIYNNNDLSKGIERMLDDQSYYLIGYQPESETFDPIKRRFNKLVVKVNRKGARVRYRSGFFGITDEQIESQPKAQTPSQQIFTALTSPFAANGISLRLNTLFGYDAQQGSFVRSLLHVNAKDIKFTAETDGNYKAVLDVVAISFGDNGTIVDQIAKTYTLRAKGEVYRKIITEGFVYHFTFPVKKAGAYQYRVAIRDSETQKIGSANQFIEVPNLKKERLTISGVVLENLTAEQWNKFAAVSPDPSISTDTSQPEADPLTATSLRRFKRGTILRYGFEVYNAKLDSARKPKLTSQIKVFRDGSLILDGKNVPFEMSRQTDLQKLKFVGAINLGSDMQLGEYILQITVTDELAKKKRQIATQFVQLEIQ